MAKSSSHKQYTRVSVLVALAFLSALIVASFLLYEPSSSEGGGEGEGKEVSESGGN